MEYKELSQYFYEDASASRAGNLQEEYRRRFEADSTFRLGYKTANGELFFAVPRDMSVLNEQVLHNEHLMAYLFAHLPDIAQKALLRGMVLDEVVCTNAIERIHSTRQQVKHALDATCSTAPANRRFRELATLYLGICDGATALPLNAAEVRDLYDTVTAHEISPNNFPDGTLFRKNGVDIIAGGSRVIHRGLEPESKIIEAVEHMLAITRDERIPKLYRAIAAHYLFEYSHPFYDGNGRTGRYLLSLNISKALSVPTAISLSRIISENTSLYYRAFSSAEAPLNHAELTFFIIEMLNMINMAQRDIFERVEACEKRMADLQSARSLIAEKFDLTERELEVVYLLLHYEVFGLIGDVSLGDIAEHLAIKPQMARKHLLSLEEKDIACKCNKRDPLTFTLTQRLRDAVALDC